MLRSKLPLILLISGLFTLSAATQNTPPPSSGLGKVSFPISCSPGVRPTFERGVAELHSFQYGAAEGLFNAIVTVDPGCAMAYWGLAMSHYHALWDGADENAVRKGRGFLETARKIGTRDKREREYIDALAIILSGDHAASAGKLAEYSHALGEICKDYPDDGEAQAFYALSLLTIPGKGDEIETRQQA